MEALNSGKVKEGNRDRGPGGGGGSSKYVKRNEGGTKKVATVGGGGQKTGIDYFYLVICFNCLCSVVNRVLHLLLTKYIFIYI